MAALLSDFASRIINAYVAAGKPENISDFITEFLGTPAPVKKTKKKPVVDGPTCCAMTAKGVKCTKIVKPDQTLCAIHLKKANGGEASTQCSVCETDTNVGDVVMTSRRMALLEEALEN